jgi:hypothetical protein
MTERERWIVYPLLFLALGAALRDKLSEQTNTKLIRCQELVVTGEEIGGKEGEMLVHISAVKRTSANSPHLGQITVKGFVQANEMHADVIGASTVNADNYFFRRLPFGQLLLGDILRILQHQAASAASGAPSAGPVPAPADQPAPPPTPQKPTTETAPQPPTDAAPPAE